MHCWHHKHTGWCHPFGEKGHLYRVQTIGNNIKDALSRLTAPPYRHSSNHGRVTHRLKRALQWFKDVRWIRKSILYEKKNLFFFFFEATLRCTGWENNKILIRVQYFLGKTCNKVHFSWDLACWFRSATTLSNTCWIKEWTEGFSTPRINNELIRQMKYALVQSLF